MRATLATGYNHTATRMDTTTKHTDTKNKAAHDDRPQKTNLNHLALVQAPSPPDAAPRRTSTQGCVLLTFGMCTSHELIVMLPLSSLNRCKQHMFLAHGRAHRTHAAYPNLLTAQCPLEAFSPYAVSSSPRGTLKSTYRSYLWKAARPPPEQPRWNSTRRRGCKNEGGRGRGQLGKIVGKGSKQSCAWAGN
mmetsp:Transcript_20699/g.63348  ORF Transcript_20699/g.63348 Transcript_20699/m.63348 type:complete len:191 (+) Transcript_20699:322-894(+)